MSRDIAQVCREACGGLGFSSYSGISRYRSYQDIHTTWEGDNSVLIQQTGKYILKILQKSFKGQKIVPPTLSFLKFDIKEVRSFKSKFSNREELENDDILIELLEYRVNCLMHECVLRLQENSLKAKDMSEAWNNTQVFYVQELSKAYGELTMTKSFKRFYQEVYSDCKETGNVVKKFFYLFVFDRILNCASFYLESAISKTQEKIVKDSILQLCDELAPFSVCVVDALAPSDKILGSAIGAADGQAYTNMINVVEADPHVYSKPKWLHLINEIRNSKNLIV